MAGAAGHGDASQGLGSCVLEIPACQVVAWTRRERACRNWWAAGCFLEQIPQKSVCGREVFWVSRTLAPVELSLLDPSACFLLA